jgi:hypothetical protein
MNLINDIGHGASHLANEVVNHVVKPTTGIVNDAQQKIIKAAQDKANALINDAKNKADNIIKEAVESAKDEVEKNKLNIINNLYDRISKHFEESDKWYLRIIGMLMRKYEDSLKKEIKGIV